MKKYLILIILSSGLIVLAFYGLWANYQEEVNILSDTVILMDFIFKLLAGVAFLIAGLAGMKKYKKNN
ncbi:MAG: hypothetical protein ACE3L7_32185 [Candidatus Pristimantibacillus sp.]